VGRYWRAGASECQNENTAVAVVLLHEIGDPVGFLMRDGIEQRTYLGKLRARASLGGENSMLQSHLGWEA
jgi:hypothetical protein